MKKDLIGNKRANIPITLLVIGVFGLCSVAILTFFISDLEISNSFIGVDILHKVNSILDEYSFYKNQGVSQESLDSFFEFEEEGGRKYIYYEKSPERGGFLGFGAKETFLFSVRAPVPLE